MLNEVAPLQLLENNFRTGGCALKESTAHGGPMLKWGPSRSVIYEDKPLQEWVFCQDLSPCRRLMLGQSVPEGLQPMLEQRVENCSYRKTHTGVVHEGLCPVGHHDGAREECEEEGRAEKICDEVDTSPFPIPLCYL
ncbi:hypothetical protein HGM15179_003529 [Zosterops borbonicus]|uniref:Uncharacterized protein n=1 Tax=Zosterops borbonicus TaxID=364589 RepID=A0A8K1GQT5_9PASS|nr:hypothetical protein HGM15179_003529 [Zosterops borbonicus]